MPKRRWTAGRMYLVLLAALVLLIGLSGQLGGSRATRADMSMMLGMLVIGGVYMLPTVIASVRRAEGAGMLGLVNMVAGWTVFGWMACLGWALTSPRRDDGYYLYQQVPDQQVVQPVYYVYVQGSPPPAAAVSPAPLVQPRYHVEQVYPPGSHPL